uniref:V-SNARE coiled-coil homology domain-containing protein n=1 Tax=Oryza glumipatula TaxID=40148 RepID=A0A0D9ZE85_9ORYZ
MVKLTMVARVTDGLPLAEGLDDGRDQKDADFYKQQAKLLFKNLSKGQHEASRMSIETGPYFFQYPYVLCDTFIQKTKKLYLDTRTQRNLVKLNDELYEVHQIMTRNVQEVLGVGEKLDQVTEMSTRLTSDTRMYADKAKDLNRQFTIYGQLRLIYGMHKPFGFQALIRKYAPVAIVIGVVLMLFWLKNKIW